MHPLRGGAAAEKFEAVTHNVDHGVPVLDDALAWFVCDVHERFPGGDHSIFTGLVRECGAVHGRRPLVYFRSRFRLVRHLNTYDLYAREGTGHAAG